MADRIVFEETGTVSFTEPVFFSVRSFNGRPHYSLEFGDHSSRWTKQDKAAILYRAEVTGTTMTLTEMVTAYEKGWRAKVKPEPPRPPAPKTYNSLKARRQG